MISFVKSSIVILALLSICPFSTHGQKNLKYSKGYVLIAKDTLKGFIHSDIQRLMHQSCKFKSGTDSPTTDYLPSQIKGFYSEEIGYFRSIKNVKFSGMESGEYYFQELEKGKASLLLYLILRRVSRLGDSAANAMRRSKEKELDKY